ncbi:RNA-binding protein [Ottowia caeni]|uniref:RNA-binding protein n=1 Tax=Ottowia caeni TaxID=2870339 RepID=UPI001E3AB3DA|nr:RNA-binding protein [Ottowia caeni]
MKTLDDLKHCANVSALRKAVRAICADFGAVKRLEVLTTEQEGVPQAICFLSLDDPEKEIELMRSLGVGRFGGEIVFVVDLAPAADGRAASVHPEWAVTTRAGELDLFQPDGRVVEWTRDPPDP